MGKGKVEEVNPQLTEQSPWHTMTVEQTIIQLGLKSDHIKLV